MNIASPIPMKRERRAETNLSEFTISSNPKKIVKSIPMKNQSSLLRSFAKKWKGREAEH